MKNEDLPDIWIIESDNEDWLEIFFDQKVIGNGFSDGPVLNRFMDARRVTFIWDQRRQKFLLGEFPDELIEKEVSNKEKKKFVKPIKFSLKPSGIIKPETYCVNCDKDFLTTRSFNPFLP